MIYNISEIEYFTYNDDINNKEVSLNKLLPTAK